MKVRLGPPGLSPLRSTVSKQAQSFETSQLCDLGLLLWPAVQFLLSQCQSRIFPSSQDFHYLSSTRQSFGRVLILKATGVKRHWIDHHGPMNIVRSERCLKVPLISESMEQSCSSHGRLDMRIVRSRLFLRFYPMYLTSSQQP